MNYKSVNQEKQVKNKQYEKLKKFNGYTITFKENLDEGATFFAFVKENDYDHAMQHCHTDYWRGMEVVIMCPSYKTTFNGTEAIELTNPLFPTSRMPNTMLIKNIPTTSIHVTDNLPAIIEDQIVSLRCVYFRLIFIPYCN